MRGSVVIVSVLVGCSAQSALGYLQPPPSTKQHVGLGSINGRLALALQNEYRARAERVQPPVSLVPTDGSELALNKLAADVSIEGPIAHTELRFAFHNAEQRTREGRFAITLPPSAAVTRFAMKIDGEWREARVVAREQGRQVYERFLHRNVDPALLEQDLGNQFSARVFPIAALEDKEIILAYDHQVSSTYALALHGLPKIGQLSIAIDNNGDKRAIAQADVVPYDVSVDLVRGPAAVSAGEAFVARVDGVGASGGDAPLDRVLYLVDTSASRAPVMGRQTQVLRELLREHPVGSTVAITVFDQTTVELYRGPATQAEGALARILHHGALGSSNLGAALERATTAGMSRVVIIGDGVVTAGEHDVAKLSSIVSGSSIERVDAVQVGQSLDRTTLQRIVRAGRKPGAVLDGGAPAIAGRQLATRIAPPVAVTVDGAAQTWPATTRDVAPGEPVFVFGLRQGDGPLVVRVGDNAVTVTPRKGHARLRRAVARAELAGLIERAQGERGDAQQQLGDEIEKLALAHELVSPRTSLIVLETDADEQAFLGPRDPPKTGITINLPTGRTFESALGAAAGTQVDSYGVSFSGATSLENTYVVDGVNTTGLTFGTISTTVGAELCLITSPDPHGMHGATRPYVRADVMSPLALDLAAEAIRHNAFAFGRPGEFYEPPSDPKPTYQKPYTGTFLEVMSIIAAHEPRALEVATEWHVKHPGDVAAILALGEALEAIGAGNLAARAYGSIADLYPNRAELLRAAGERLDRIAGARTLAIDFYRRAVRERPDHASTYRLLAWALFRANRADEALDVLTEGLKHAQRDSVQQILAEDASIIAANIVARQPARRYALPTLPFPIAISPTLRFVLTWETDANDVDLHVRDGRGGHAFYKGTRLDSGGRLLDDLTDGYGPEMFVVENPTAFPYKLSAHYYNKGPMGLGLGTVQVIRHDGAGGVVVEDRPFVIQNDGAMVELGVVAAR